MPTTTIDNRMTEERRTTADFPLWEIKPGPRDARFVRDTLTATLALICFVAATNFIVNPYGRYRVSLFRPVVDSQRSSKVQVFKAHPGPISTVITGTSRTQRVDPNCVEKVVGGSAFNFAVPNARIETAHAIAEFALANSPLRRFIIGTDELMFWDDDYDDLLLQSRELRPFINHPPPRSLAATLSPLLGAEAAKLTLHSLLASVTHSQPERPMRADGFMPPDGPAPGTRQAEKKFQENVQRYSHTFSGYRTLSPKRVSEFVDMVTALHAHNVEVIAFIPPMQPRFREKLKNTMASARTADLRALLIELQNKGLLKFYDSSDITSFGGDPLGYRDGVHMTDANGLKLVAAMLGKPGACAL